MKLACVTGFALAGAIWLAGCGAAGDESGAEVDAIDLDLATLGAELLKSKGCTACHTVGEGRLVGPDLGGVTERRSREFVVAMIVNPDSMLANDDDAKALLAEYFTPMPEQGVSNDEAVALFEYFRRHDAETAEMNGDTGDR